MKSWILPLALGALSALGAHGITLGIEQDPAAEENEEESAAERRLRKVRALFAAMNQRAVMEASTRVSAEAFAEMGLPDEFTREFVERFDHDLMIERSVEVYLERIEEETVDALLAFYEGEQGKLSAAALPELTVELIRIGQAYGKELALEIAQGR